ncbi:hypothetical protein ACLKA7_015532 [Drosophila subpalustris]
MIKCFWNGFYNWLGEIILDLVHHRPKATLRRRMVPLKAPFLNALLHQPGVFFMWQTLQRQTYTATHMAS